MSAKRAKNEYEAGVKFKSSCGRYVVCPEPAAKGWDSDFDVYLPCAEATRMGAVGCVGPYARGEHTRRALNLSEGESETT